LLLYLHIPFCDSKCHYCAFCSYTDKAQLKKPYSSAITKQFNFEAQRLEIKKGSINSLFVGGGTPSTFPASLYEPFMFAVSPYLSKDAEITTEANPNSATLSWLEGMRSFGFGRVSFGVQSFDDKKLKFLGRIHSQKDAIEAILNAEKVGFKNISIDLMYDTKADTKKLLQNDIEIASSLPINHLSAYSLTIEKNTKFYNHQNARKESLVLAKYMVNSLAQKGFGQYEISNFSRGYECFHNKRYWEGDDYIGVGCGAVGFYKNRRFYPSQNPQAYIKNPTHQEVEQLSVDDLRLERVFLAMRSNVGLLMDDLPQKIKDKLTLLADEKKGVVVGGRFYNLDYFIADEMALFVTS